MSQADIYHLLKKNNNREFSQKEIAKELNLNIGVVCLSLKKLVKYREIKVEIKRINGRKRLFFSFKK